VSNCFSEVEVAGARGSVLEDTVSALSANIAHADHSLLQQRRYGTPASAVKRAACEAERTR
jgi:hypothetical protein